MNDLDQRHASSNLVDRLWQTARPHLRTATINGLLQAEKIKPQGLFPKFGRVQIVVLHEVPAEEEYTFRQMLESLQPHYRFVRYSAAVATIARGNPTQPLLAFTFDDGLESCRRAARILEEFDASACFFVCPSIVGSNEMEGDEFSRQRLKTSGGKFLGWRDVEVLLDNGHEIGGHTFRHIDLASASPEQIWEDSELCHEALQARLGCVSHFAWPYGQFRHITARAVQAVFAAGFTSCASGVRGSHANLLPRKLADTCIYRDSLRTDWPAEHAAFFLARSARQRQLDPGWPWHCQSREQKPAA